jgi:hypothetical protein
MNLQCASVTHGGPLTLSTATVLSLHTAFFALTLSFNALASVLIAGRLLRLRRTLAALGPAAHPALGAAGLVGVLAESAAAYAVVGLVYLPFYVHVLPASAVLSTLFQALAVRST